MKGAVALAARIHDDLDRFIIDFVSPATHEESGYPDSNYQS